MITISDEEILELAKKGVEEHIHKVMYAFAKDDYSTTAGYDPRLRAIVEGTVRKIIVNDFLPIIREEIKNVIPGLLTNIIKGGITIGLDMYDEDEK